MYDYLDYDFRINQLKNLKSALLKNENKILNALQKDMNKPNYEAYTSEIGLLYIELNDAIKNLKKWMKNEKKKTPIYIQPAKSYIKPVPKGKILIISPWNYPFLLTFSPLIGAIASGNRVFIKPSNKSFYSSQVIDKIIKDTFKNDYIKSITGPGNTVVSPLIEKENFDHIFFTGSLSIGKKIYKQAANNLVPVTLELGGKSPSIVDSTGDLNDAAKKIVWSKFFNSGQTCIATDYLIIKDDLKNLFIEKLINQIKVFYGDNPSLSKDLSSIIDINRFNKLESLIIKENIIYSGKNNKDKLFIHPTIVDANLDDDIMKEEIFGPILPIITYNNMDDLTNIIENNPNPLALYLFTKDNDFKNFIFNHINFGGGCLNDAISHMINTNLPFGGTKNSGIGSYHSYYTFKEFSHFKSIVESNTKIDLSFKYPPYTEENLKLTKIFLK